MNDNRQNHNKVKILQSIKANTPYSASAPYGA